MNSQEQINKELQEIVDYKTEFQSVYINAKDKQLEKNLLLEQQTRKQLVSIFKKIKEAKEDSILIRESDCDTHNKNIKKALRKAGYKIKPHYKMKDLRNHLDTKSQIIHSILAIILSVFVIWRGLEYKYCKTDTSQFFTTISILLGGIIALGLWANLHLSFQREKTGSFYILW